jgi:hypothetical protein
MQEDRPPREVREPRLFGLIPRERAYLILMGVCLLLIILAWTLIWRYSTIAAVAMSAVALVIAGRRDHRQRGPGQQAVTGWGVTTGPFGKLCLKIGQFVVLNNSSLRR